MQQYTYTNTKGATWYLNRRISISEKTRKETILYFFSKNPRPETAVPANEFPADREVKESKANGFPMVVKKV